MPNRFQKIIQRYKSITANLAGSDYKFTVSRPDYTVVDNTPTVINTNVKFYLEATQQNLTQDKLPGVEFYSITGNSNLFKSGDIISGVSDLPTITVVTVPDEQEFLGVKTPKIGKFFNMGDDLYTNVYFDYMSANTDGNQEFLNLDPSFSIPRRKIIIYTRANIREGINFQDLTPNQGANTKWKVSEVDYRDQIVIVYLNNPDRG